MRTYEHERSRGRAQRSDRPCTGTPGRVRGAGARGRGHGCGSAQAAHDDPPGERSHPGHLLRHPNGRATPSPGGRTALAASPPHDASAPNHGRRRCVVWAARPPRHPRPRSHEHLLVGPGHGPNRRYSQVLSAPCPSVVDIHPIACPLSVDVLSTGDVRFRYTPRERRTPCRRKPPSG